MIQTTDRLLILEKTFSVLQKQILHKNRQKLLRPEAEKWRPRQKLLRPEAQKSAKTNSPNNRQKLLRPEAEKWHPRQKSLRPEAEKWEKKPRS